MTIVSHANELLAAWEYDVTAYRRPCSHTEKLIRIGDFLREGETAFLREGRICSALTTAEISKLNLGRLTWQP